MLLLYVEGASDKKAMEVLLDNLIEEKREQGIAIHFVEAPPGDKKQVMLSKIPNIGLSYFASVLPEHRKGALKKLR